MADGYGARPQGYDYSDYYGGAGTPGQEQMLKSVAPGMSIADKIRGMFGMLGGDTSPVDPRSTAVGDKIRGGLGLAPLVARGTQGEVRGSDNAIATGTLPIPAKPSAAVSSVSDYLNGPGATANSAHSSLAPSDAVAPPIVSGAYADPHEASPGVGAQIVAGPATPSVSVSRDGSGNLMFTNAPPAIGAVPNTPPPYQAKPGSLASFYGAAMNERRAARQDTLTAAQTLKTPEMLKHQAEAVTLAERFRLATDPQTDPATRAVLLGAHPPPFHAPQIPIANQPSDPTRSVNMVTIGGDGKPVAQNIPIQQNITIAEAIASAKRNNTYKSDAQVRADMKNKPQFRLID